MVYYTVTNTQVNGLYTGNCYAFGASGGFIVQQGFRQIELETPDLLNRYDVTDAVQVQFSARTLNKKIGILKDSSNSRVIEAWFDNITQTLYHDNLKVCTCDFIDGINTDSVLSVGRLKQLYTDFKYCVGYYFGDPGGFSSLFSNVTEFDINNGGVFDASAYIQVVNSSTFTMTGSFVSDLSGHITVSDINKTLQYAVDSNLFRNRYPTDKNYGIVDGFIAGDLIFIPDGFTISLSVDIEAETILPINNIGPTYLNSIRDKLNWTKGHVKRTTTATTTNITQTTTVPILLVLTDDTLENYTNYGTTWTASSNISTDPSNNGIGNSNNWLGITISSTGKYQSVIDQSGNIYISDNYGNMRTVTHNVGQSDVNSIAMSFTGMHQTVSNGNKIFVSDDFGVTWRPTFDNGNSNIYVAISLSGRYQTVVSCGDNVYRSEDYGETWTSLDYESILFQSVETFPTAGIAISYNGMYQTIVTENIYVSRDYGQTFVDVTNSDFEDRNWQGICISSDAKYQTAIENGGDIYVSNDFGYTWNFVNDVNVTNKRWKSNSMSATGQYQTALEENGKIHVSNDYGVTWTTVGDPSVADKNWQWVAVSSDGLYQCAIEYGGTIYTSKVMTSTPTPGSADCICD